MNGLSKLSTDFNNMKPEVKGTIALTAAISSSVPTSGWKNTLVGEITNGGRDKTYHHKRIIKT